MRNRPGEKIKLASLDELLGVVNEECHDPGGIKYRCIDR